MKPSDSQKIIERVKGLYQRYREEMTYFNMAGSIFYIFQATDWLTEQSKEYFGSTVPFFLVYFLKNGTGQLETPFYLGPGALTMETIEKDGKKWLEKNRQEIIIAEKKLFQWLNNHSIESGKSLKYYLELLHESHAELLKANIYSQVSSQIDKPLNVKVLKTFREAGNNLSDDQILALCISDKKPDVLLHEDSLLKLYEWCKVNKIDLSINKYQESIKNQNFFEQLKECYDQGYFLHSGYGGVTLWTLQDEFNLINQIKKDKTDTSIIYYYKDFKLTKKQKFWVKVAKYFSEIRDRRKSLQQKLFYYQACIIEEISQIIGISRKELENLRIEQFTLNLIKEGVAKELIKNQKEAYLLFWEPNSSFNIWTNKDAMKAYKDVNKNLFKKTNILKGRSASGGKSTGRVRIVPNPKFVPDFKEGDVLVTGMTSPDFVPLMKRAAAVITEQGGITCHAAIISRELGIPCVIGTGNATKVLHDGDLVEVDADKGIIKIIK